MKRIGAAVATAVGFVLCVAAPALADYPPPVRPGGPHVSGAGGAAGTAFTGANVSFGMLALVLLAVVGVTALLVSRRRAVSAA